MSSEGQAIREEAQCVLIAYEGYEWAEEASAALAEAAIRMARHALALEARLAEALQENGRLALEAATADQDWKKAEARLAETEQALREITQTDWNGNEGITPFQFEQRVHKIAADALMALPSESGTA